MSGDEMKFGASRGLPLLGRVLAAPLLALIWLYKRAISPLLPPSCRFFPSCSQYGFTAIALHGPFKGTWLTLRRVTRCHPLCPGGYDPVPGTDEARALALREGRSVDAGAA